MQTDQLERSPTWVMRVLAPLVTLILLVTGAFGSGAYWDRLHSQGDPAHGRAALPQADSQLGRQIMFRIGEDACSTVALLLEQAKADGWRGVQARGILTQIRAQVNR